MRRNVPDAVTIATTCLRAWSSGDFDTARSLLRDDVTFAGPTGTDRGAEAYLSGLVELAQHVRGADPKKVVVDGDDVCIMYDLVTEAAGTVPAADWYHVAGGKIDSVHTYFDARPLSETPPLPPVVVGGTVLACGLPARFSAEMELADWP
jgi:ketosteroid isomerase-like protein